VKKSSADPYCYPGTEVLRNLKNIRDPEKLAAFEAEKVALHLARLREEPLHGPFDLNRLLATHRHIFSGIYAWAGELRRDTGTMKKFRQGHLVTYGDSAFVLPALGDLFKKLSGEDFLRGLTPEAFAVRAAYFYGEFDAIHPFREGNSRTLRQFFRDLAQAAGYILDWTAASATEEQRQQIVLARDIAVMRGDSSPLAGIILANLHRDRE
jgi:cell filamentation protein